MRCRDGHECKEGLFCSTDKMCVRFAQGSRCSSDFWCLNGLQCCKLTRECTLGYVPPRYRFPPVPCSSKCSSSLDFAGKMMDGRCLNGVCLPHRLAWPCDDIRKPSGLGFRCILGVQVPGIKDRACENEFQCLNGMTCRSGKCAERRIGEQCFGSSDCSRFSRCETSRTKWACTRPGRGEESERSEQCKDTLRCIPNKVLSHRGGLCAVA